MASLGSEDVDLVRPADRQFAATLRREVSAWPRPPAGLMIDAPAGELPLVAWLDIVDTVAGGAIMTIGVHVADGQVVGDKLHNQLFTLAAPPTAIRFSATGSSVDLATRTSDWLFSVVDRDYSVQEWLHDGLVYARWSVVAETEEPLAGQYFQKRAPESAQFPARAWPQLRDLGTPDRTARLRVEY